LLAGEKGIIMKNFSGLSFREIAYQERILKSRLQALGIPTEELELKAE